MGQIPQVFRIMSLDSLGREKASVASSKREDLWRSRPEYSVQSLQRGEHHNNPVWRNEGVGGERGTMEAIKIHHLVEAMIGVSGTQHKFPVRETERKREQISGNYLVEKANNLNHSLLC